MGLFDAIDEFFTGSTADMEMIMSSSSSSSAAAAAAAAGRLNELQDEEDRLGLAQAPSSPSFRKRRQLSSSSEYSSDGGDSGGSKNLSLFLIVGMIVIYLTYEFGVGNGLKVSGGSIDHTDKPLPTITGTSSFATTPTFTKEILRDTRQAAKELINVLHNYYGGETQAKAMLVESWQAHWYLEKEAFLSENIDLVGQNINFNGNDDDSVNHGDNGRKLGKQKGGVKKANNILNNPDFMTPEQLTQHHQNKKERTTKLITTMARALLDPTQTKFTIGTIGSSVAAGHDNCHYDSYESQLERTLFPIFAAAKMDVQVQNAGEGGGCGDSHKNQVFCVTQNLSPDVDIIHYSWVSYTFSIFSFIHFKPYSCLNSLHVTLDILREGRGGRTARATRAVGTKNA